MEIFIILVLTALSSIYLYKKIFNSNTDKCSKCSFSSSCQSGNDKGFRGINCD